MKPKLSVVALLLPGTIVFALTSTSWASDPLVAPPPGWSYNGSPICNEPHTQDQVAIAAGDSFAVVVWRDNRNDPDDPFDIYGQVVHFNGSVLTSPSEGSAICTATGPQTEPAICLGPDNVIWSAWMDSRSCAYPQIYAQAFDGSGSDFCATNGIAQVTCNGASSDRGSHHPSILSGTEGAAITAWNYRPPVGFGYQGDRIQVQKMSASTCSVQWGANGVQVYGISWTGTADMYPAMIPDGAGGALVAWADDISGYVYVRKVDSGGAAAWGSEVRVCTSTTEQRSPSIAPDGSGGVLVVWEDGGDGVRMIRGQRIDSDGNRQWGDCGVLIGGGAGDASSPQIVRSDLGRSHVYWQVNFGGGNQDIYTQRISFLGDTLSARVAVCTAPFAQVAPKAVSSTNGSSIVVWEDGRDVAIGDTGDIYCQRLSADGLPLGPTNGMAVCDLDGSRQYAPLVASAPDGGALVVWSDTRNGNPDIFGLLLTVPSQTTGVGDQPISRERGLSTPAPNPFFVSTRVRFSLPSASPVSISVYNIQGEAVRVLKEAAGRGAVESEVSWDGRDDEGQYVPNGIYYFRLVAGGMVSTRPVIYLR